MNCKCDMAPIVFPSGVRLLASRGTPIEVTEGVFITVDHNEQCPVRLLRDCAALVRAAGCLCWAIRDWDDSADLVIEDVYDNQGIIVGEEVTVHDRRCSHALAAAIEARQ